MRRFPDSGRFLNPRRLLNTGVGAAVKAGSGLTVLAVILVAGRKWH